MGRIKNRRLRSNGNKKRQFYCAFFVKRIKYIDGDNLRKSLEVIQKQRKTDRHTFSSKQLAFHP